MRPHVPVTILLLALAGCSATYTGADGRTHVIGLVDIAIAPTHGSALAGDIVEVTTIGLALASTPREVSLALGYSRTTTAAFRDNVLALGPFDSRAFAPPPAPQAASTSSPRKPVTEPLP